MRFTAMANIFLLEDDKILSKGISIALKKDEHTVTAVYGYLEALQQYQKQKYDLFLLDINLPDGNGLEFCKKIRETSETPVLFLTANDTEEDMLEGFGVGCDDYISKPFSIEVLRKKVLAVLKRTGIGKFRMKYRDLELDKDNEGTGNTFDLNRIQIAPLSNGKQGKGCYKGNAFGTALGYRRKLC